jgi:hypothetical protein
VELGISPSIPPFYSFIIPKITSTREREKEVWKISQHPIKKVEKVAEKGQMGELFYQ